MSNTVKNTNTIVGAWSQWNFTIDQDAKDVYADATSANEKYRYGTPSAYAFRATPEDNFSFLAPVTFYNEDSEEEVTSLANIHITSLSGKSEVIRTDLLKPEATDFPGGWGSWQFPVGEEAQAEFDKTDLPLGLDYDLLGSSLQIVAGLNCAYLSKATPVVPDATSFAAIVRIFAPLYSDPDVKENQFISIRKINPWTSK